jgi:hypothetical protein
MLGEEELPGHLGPHPGPIGSRQGRVHRKAGCRIDCSDAFRHLQPKRAGDTINDLERHAKLGRILQVTSGEVRPFQLLLPELG